MPQASLRPALRGSPAASAARINPRRVQLQLLPVRHNDEDSDEGDAQTVAKIKKVASLSHSDDRLHPPWIENGCTWGWLVTVACVCVACLLGGSAVLWPDGGATSPSLEDRRSIRERAPKLWTDAISRAPCQHLSLKADVPTYPGILVDEHRLLLLLQNYLCRRLRVLFAATLYRKHPRRPSSPPLHSSRGPQNPGARTSPARNHHGPTPRTRAIAVSAAACTGDTVTRVSRHQHHPHAAEAQAVQHRGLSQEGRHGRRAAIVP